MITSTENVTFSRKLRMWIPFGILWWFNLQTEINSGLIRLSDPELTVQAGWVGPRAGLDGCWKSRPIGIRSPDRRANSTSLYRPRFHGPQCVYTHTHITHTHIHIYIHTYAHTHMHTRIYLSRIISSSRITQVISQFMACPVFMGICPTFLWSTYVSSTDSTRCMCTVRSY
jgi:hypothetical protein